MLFWIEFFKLFFVLTYIVVGFIIAFESILCMGRVEIAKNWVRSKYKLKGFMLSTYIFYPMLLIVYLFFELIPYFIGLTKKISKFDIPSMIYYIFEEECDKCDSNK